MRIPSTSDLAQREANHAYDKLAVISENIESLEELYDFMFQLKQYFKNLLAEYVTKHTDETIDSQKTFLEHIRLEAIKFFNQEDHNEDFGFIGAEYNADCEPCLLFKVSRKDVETENTITSQLKLILNTCNNTARFEIPPTDGTVNESAVRVDYLHTILATLSSDITNSAQAMEDLLNRLVALENVINPIKNYLRIGIISYPVDDSNALVTSNGIYDFVQDLLGQVPPNTDTTYTFSFDPGTNKIVITPSSGTGTELDLSSLAGTAQVNKSIGTLVSCFIDSTHPTDANDVGQHITVPVGKILTGSDLIEFVETGTEFNTNTQSVDATDTVFAENDDGSINDTGWIPAWNDTWNVSNMSTETRYKCIVSPTFETSTVGDGNSTPTYKLTAGIFMRVL